MPVKIVSSLDILYLVLQIFHHMFAGAETFNAMQL